MAESNPYILTAQSGQDYDDYKDYALDALLDAGLTEDDLRHVETMLCLAVPVGPLFPENALCVFRLVDGRTVASWAHGGDGLVTKAEIGQLLESIAGLGQALIKAQMLITG
jgi:hypothetical protein